MRWWRRRRPAKGSAARRPSGPVELLLDGAAFVLRAFAGRGGGPEARRALRHHRRRTAWVRGASGRAVGATGRAGSGVVRAVRMARRVVGRRRR